MADVFISYSRRDKIFVRRFFDALERTGRDAWVDWEGIPYSTEWWREIQAGIDQADTFIFVITPDSLGSKICHEEVTYAYKHNKRIVPIVRQEINEKEVAGVWFNKDWEFTARDNWEILKRINWLYFRRRHGCTCEYDQNNEVINPECDGPGCDYDSFDEAFQALLKTIETDIEHVRMHTRLLVRAREWETSGRNRSFLLRGEDLDHAEKWLAIAAGKDQKPDELHTEYILSSRAEQRRQQRNLLAGMATGLLVAIALSLLSFLLFRQSEDRLSLAQSRATGEANQARTSDANALTAISAQGEAENQATAAFNAALTSDANALTATIAQGEAEIQATLAFNAARTSDANAVTATVAVATALIAQQESEAQATVAWQNAGTAIAAQSTSDANALLAQNNAIISDANARLAIDNAATATVAQGEAENQATVAWQNASTAGAAQMTADANAQLALNNAATATVAQGEAESQATVAWQNASTAEAAQMTADANAVLAQNNAATSDANLRAAWNLQSLFLADQSRQQLLAGAPQESLLLALESLRHYEDGIFNPSSQTALLNAVTYPVSEAAYMRHDADVSWAFWNQDGTRVLSYSSDGTARLWDATTGEALLVLWHDGAVRGAYWALNDTRILTASADGTARLWDASTGELLLTVRHAATVDGVTMHPDGTKILTYSDDFTARVWDIQTGEELLRLTHEDQVNAAYWDETQTRILSWSNDGTVRLWDAATGEIIHIFRHSDQHGLVIAGWNPDKTKLLSWGDDGTVKVWDASTGELLQTMTHPSWVTSLRWSKDGNRILTHSNDSSFCEDCVHATYVWEVNTGENLLLLPHDSFVNGEAYSPDETRILTWAQDYAAHVWDANTGEELLRLDHDEIVWTALWNKDGSQILTASRDGTVRIWNATNGAVLAQMRHQDEVNSASWSPDESRVMSWSEDQSIRIWEITGGEILPTVHHPDQVSAASWSASQNLVLSRSREIAYVWEAATGDILKSLEGYDIVAWRPDEEILVLVDNELTDCHRDCDPRIRFYDPMTDTILQTFSQPEEIQAIEWEENDLITYGWDGSVRVWDIENGVSMVVGTFGEVNILDWHQETNRLLTHTSSNTAILWDTITQNPLFTFQCEGELYGAEFNQDGQRIFTYCADGTVRSWETSSGQELRRLTLPGSVYGIEINEDYSRILAWSQDETVYVWNTETGESIMTLPQAGGNFVLWSTDETRIIAGSTKGPVSVWDANTGERLLLLIPEGAPEIFGSIWEMELNSDDTRLVVAYLDNDITDLLGGTVRVWDLQTGEMLVEFHHQGDVRGANWSQDDSQILVWSSDGMVRIWPLSLELLIDIAQEQVTRQLTNEERASFFIETLVPTPTLPVTPSATPLPTLTPFPSPTPTATQSLISLLGFAPLPVEDIAGFAFGSERIFEDAAAEYGNSAPLLAPNSPAYQRYYIGAGDAVFWVIQSSSVYSTVEAWKNDVRFAGDIQVLDGIEVGFFEGETITLWVFIHDGVFVSVLTDGIDLPMSQAVLDAVLPD
ncbi:MAG: TIR domain-containing protein [Anaerolineae bacterium]|nr:TIR domain-containing protein [Anaerolineae bacterium]